MLVHGRSTPPSKLFFGIQDGDKRQKRDSHDQLTTEAFNMGEQYYEKAKLPAMLRKMESIDMEA